MVISKARRDRPEDQRPPPEDGREENQGGTWVLAGVMEQPN